MTDLESDVANAAKQAGSVLGLGPQDPLDYSRESLALVERAIDAASHRVQSMTSAETRVLVQCVGCYVLEVGRRQFGGTYAWYEPRPQPVLVVGEPDFHVAMMAWDKIEGRLRGDKADDIVFFYDGFATAIGNAKPGTTIVYV